MTGDDGARAERRAATRSAGVALVVAIAAAGCSDHGTPPAPSPDVTISVSVGPDVSVPGNPADPDVAFRVVPEPVVPPADAVVGTGWVADEPGTLWVMTIGSSSNPTVATGAAVDGQTVIVTLAEMVPGALTSADSVPWTSQTVVPSGVDPATAVTVVLGALGSVELTGPRAEAWVLETP